MFKVTVCFYVKHPRGSGISMRQAGLVELRLSWQWQCWDKKHDPIIGLVLWKIHDNRRKQNTLKPSLEPVLAMAIEGSCDLLKKGCTMPKPGWWEEKATLLARGGSFWFPYISGSSGAQDAEFHTAPNWKIHKAEIHQMNFMLNNAEFHRVPVAFISSSTTIIAPAVGFAMLGLSFLGSHPRYLLCNVPFWFHVVVNITMFGGSNPRTWLKAKYVSSMDMMLWKSKIIGWIRNAHSLKFWRLFIGWILMIWVNSHDLEISGEGVTP